MSQLLGWLPSQIIRDGWSATGEEFTIGVDFFFLQLMLLVGILVAGVHVLRRGGRLPERSELPDVSYSELEPKIHASYERVFLWGPLKNVFYRNYNSERIERYQPGQRLFYFAVAATGFVLLVSGIALLVEGIFGSGPLFTWLDWHLIAAAVLLLGLIVHVLIALTIGDFWGMAPTWADVKRSTQALKNFFGSDVEAPRFGKYSPPVKLLHWANTVLLLVLLATGIVMLRTITMPWWEAVRAPFGLAESTVGFVYLLHGLAAGLWLVVVVLHLYLAVRKWEISKSIFGGTVSRETFEKYYDPKSWRPDNVEVVSNDGGEIVTNDEEATQGRDSHE